MAPDAIYTFLGTLALIVPVQVLPARNTGVDGAKLEINATDRMEIAAGPGSMWSGLYQANGGVFATYGKGGTSYVVGPLP